DHGRQQKPTSETYEVLRRGAGIRLPVVRRRTHDQCTRDRDECEGQQMNALLRVRELAGESGVEDRYQLKAEQCLHARQHHSALLEQMCRCLGERKSLPLLLHMPLSTAPMLARAGAPRPPSRSGTLCRTRAFSSACTRPLKRFASASDARHVPVADAETAPAR